VTKENRHKPVTEDRLSEYITLVRFCRAVDFDSHLVESFYFRKIRAQQYLYVEDIIAYLLLLLWVIGNSDDTLV
jgi:hypothetical protein